MSDYLKRLAEALKKREAPMGPDAWDWQQFADTSSTGSINAPGGVSQPQERDKPQRLGKLLAGASMLPGPSGDLLGPLSDAYMYATEPESRTPGNFALSALGALPFLPSLATVYHGSPHKFDAFDLSKIGTGEGAQAYGHGLYFAENPSVALDYKRNLTADTAQLNGKPLANLTMLERDAADYAISYGGKKTALEVLDNKINANSKFDDIEWLKEIRDKLASSEFAKSDGSLYTVDLPDEAIAKMLDWDKPLSEQAPEVQPILREMLKKARKSFQGIDPDGNPIAGQVHHLYAQHRGGNAAAVAEELRALGIPGIRYLDGGSRGAGQGTYNYVVFDDKLPKILKRE